MPTHRNIGVENFHASLFYGFNLFDHLCNIDGALSERVEQDRGAWLANSLTCERLSLFTAWFRGLVQTMFGKISVIETLTY